MAVERVSKTYAGRIKALREVSLEVGAGEVVAITGPSGCGKSTLLNVIAAIERPDSGRVLVDGANVELPMIAAGVPRAERHRRAVDLLADEPTGSLDSISGNLVLSVLDRARARRGMTLMIASHDPLLGDRPDRFVHMVDGAVVDDDGP